MAYYPGAEYAGAMAQSVPRPCGRPGCRELVPRGVRYCAPCRARAQRQDVLERGTSTARGYDQAWRRLRAAYAAQHHWCEDCEAKGERVPVAIVDHVRPHRGDDALRLDWGNLRALCHRHHQAKTAREGPGYTAPRVMPGTRRGG